MHPQNQGDEHPPATQILLPEEGDVGPLALPCGAQNYLPPQPWGQGRGRTPCLHLRGPANSPQGGNPKIQRVPVKAPGAAGQQEPLTPPHSQKYPGQHGETEAQSILSRAGPQTPHGGLQPASMCPQPCDPSAHVCPVLLWALGTRCHPLPDVEDGKSLRHHARLVLNN